MGLIVVQADFEGKTAIAQNNYTDIDSYIAKYEEPYLIDLLGVELFKLFKASVTAHVPAAGIYRTIFDPIREDDTECNSVKVSEGIKQMLLGFIFFEFMKDDKFKATNSGTVAAQTELSRETGFTENDIYSRYNEALESYNTIQWYIVKKNKKVDYPLFNGQYKRLASWI